MVGRNGKSVEIITVKGRGERPILGYAGKDTDPTAWMGGPSQYEGEWDLFFAPKVEVVHVYHFRDDPAGRFVLLHDAKLKDGAQLNSLYTYLGTITGPIAPPEKREVAK